MPLELHFNFLGFVCLAYLVFLGVATHTDTYLVIMAGGIGSRFWPKSRLAKPKQFLDILDTGQSLIQMTFSRFADSIPAENIFVVTNREYIPIVKEQLPALADTQILGEPMRRNTAPCIAYACYKIAGINPDAKVIVAPSDHLILDESGFRKVIDKSLSFLDEHDSLLTIGIKPSRPDTGYGYIQFKEDTKADSFYKVKTFTEKPNLELAKTFILSGDFLWNSGIFVWGVQGILNAFKTHLPELADLFKSGPEKLNTEEEVDFIEEVYAKCTDISIDYGIMEKASNVWVIPSSFGWSDLGTWTALYEKYDKDYLGNAVKGDKVIIYDATNCMVMVPDDKQVVLQGLDNCIVVDYDGVLLICSKDKEQDIKQITADIKRNSGTKFL